MSGAPRIPGSVTVAYAATPKRHCSDVCPPAIMDMTNVGAEAIDTDVQGCERNEQSGRTCPFPAIVLPRR